jgi:REP element-mobilizing transposase RayT
MNPGKMKYNPQKHHRRSIRLKGYDYSQAGAYYVTIVAQNRLCLFGNVANAEMQLNDAGRMLQSQWEYLPQRFPNVELDEFIVMPNHIHGILVITDKTNDEFHTPDARANAAEYDPILGDIVGTWKSIATDEYIRGVHESNWEPFYGKLLQRNYWEHIIRDEEELNRIREYTINNPANWESDDYNPRNAPRRNPHS